MSEALLKVRGVMAAYQVRCDLYLPSDQRHADYGACRWHFQVHQWLLCWEGVRIWPPSFLAQVDYTW